MGRFLYILLLVALGFALGFGYREIKAEVEAKRYAKKHPTAYASHPVTQNKSFVIFAYAKNNGDVCERHLLSVLNQEYEDYRVVYIDDGSSNESYLKACSFIQNHDTEKRVTFIRHEEEVGEIESIYRMAQECQSHEVIVLLRGDDFFAHAGVLDRLNHYFADTDVWMTASDGVEYPSYEKKEREPYIQAFYAGLLKRVKLQEFLENGEFSREKMEDVIIPPMRALAKKHTYLVPETLFLCHEVRKEVERNVDTPSLKEYPWHDFSKDKERVDLLVFSYNRPLQLYAFLESSKKYVENLHRQFVIYRAGNEHYEQGYQKVKEAYPNVIYIRQSVSNPYEDFAPTVRNVVFDRDMSTARYVVFALDDNVIKDRIDMEQAARALKETGAFGFYFRLGNNLEFHPKEEKIPIQEGMYAWQFSSMEGEWGRPNSFDMTLFLKEDIYPYFICMKFHNPKILQAMLNEHADLSRVGLYYNRSKVVNLPLNVVFENEWINEKVANISTKELLSFFQQGLKMDINALDKIENRFIQIEHRVEFTKR